MGGVQSSTHNLGDALWMHERQRQRGQREAASNRYESQDGHSSDSEDRRKLLKRTRSLAVISEDHARRERETSAREFHLGEPDLESPRRPQLIPRAKLIDRNSLKDRLSKSQQHLSDSYDRFNESRSYHSHSTCDLYSVPSALSSLPDPPLYGRTSRADPDRLNILDWPRTPRRYRSHQDLDTVSGLVEIVEDNWPIDDNRSLDSIHTQVKRKRKEHRSLDSILHEDDDELEYFDVLNLLPLSKVRLEYESDAGSVGKIKKNHNDRGSNSSSSNGGFGKSHNSGFGKFIGDEDSSIERRRKFVDRDINSEERESSDIEDSEDKDGDKEDEDDDNNLLTEDSSSSEHRRSIQATNFGLKQETNVNITDEEKCKHRPNSSYPEIVEFHERRNDDTWRTNLPGSSSAADTVEPQASVSHEPLARGDKDPSDDSFLKDRSPAKPETASSLADIPEDKPVSSVRLTDPSTSRKTPVVRQVVSKARPEVEEAEDYKSIWISDSEADLEDMSRRPQVLRVIDNEVTSKRRSTACYLDTDVVGTGRPVVKDHARIGNRSRTESRQRIVASAPEVDAPVVDVEIHAKGLSRDKSEMGTARNFFERKSLLDKDETRNLHNEGRLGRIVQETSNILGKACNAVRGSLGFEARSESSDLGLGSDCGSDTRRRSIDDGVDDVIESGDNPTNQVKDRINRENEDNEDEDETTNSGRKSRSNLTRSRSCVDSIESQNEEGPEFDHVRYKIVKSRLFGKNMYGTTINKRDVTYDGLMEYLREYSFQELLMDNNVVIIEPVRAETVDRKSCNKDRSAGVSKGSASLTKRVHAQIDSSDSNESNNINENSLRSTKQSSLRKHFFYHPIRVNKELIDEELPDPDTVRNVRRMFEKTMMGAEPEQEGSANDCKSRKSVSMKDLRRIEESSLDDIEENAFPASSRSRCSSRAKDLTKLFEDKTTSSDRNKHDKGDEGSPRSETKARVLAQSFEARSGNTSPSDTGSTGDKMSRCRRANQPSNHQSHHHQQQQQRRRQLRNWDAGSVSSGVSSDYPDTDPGSGAHCTSSSDEDTDSRDECSSRESDRVSGHFVSQDVLRKIRECGTSVTYYGGKVVNTCNGPLISPTSCKLGDRIQRSLLGNEDYVKFRLVKSNSCDSRLELTGRVVERRSRLEARAQTNGRTGFRGEGCSNLRESTIAETPSIEITTIESAAECEQNTKSEYIKEELRENKREPPVVIGLEPKKDDSKDNEGSKVDFKLGKIADPKSAAYVNRFGSALTRWQINETNWKRTNADFGKIEFEEFEVLHDSLNDK